MTHDQKDRYDGLLEIVDNFETSNKEKLVHNVDFLIEHYKESMKQNGITDVSISKDQLAMIYQAASSLTISYQIEFATYLGYLALNKTLDT